MKVWVAVIEMPDGYPLDIFSGTTREIVQREAAEALTAPGLVYEDEPDFLDEHPVPNFDDAQAVSAWLDALHEATTVPWLTVEELEVFGS